MANLQGNFIFDSDDLIMYCADFENISETDHTDSSLVVALQDLQERWTNVQSAYRTIFTTKGEKLTDEFTASAKEKYRVCTSSFHRCKAKMLDLQKTFLPPPAPSPIQFPLETTESISSFGCIKVPPCDTENFQGGYEEWPSFRDMFTAVYISHPKLSPVQKLYHLRLKVKGQAAGIVKKYQLCGENFELAWEALRSRYENKRVLVDNQLRILLNLKTISVESSESLQKIQTTINDCLAILKTHNISTQDWDPILVHLCSSKLPHETLSLWEQSLDSHKELPSWPQMDNFLSNRYEVVERLDSIHGPKGVSKRPSEINSFKTEGIPRLRCKLCDLTHPLKNSSRFRDLSPTSRNEFVTQNKICLNCLSYTHIRRDCKSKFVCMECKRNHHTLLHFPNRGAVNSSDDMGTNTQTLGANFTMASSDNDHMEPSASQGVGFSDTATVLQTSSHFSSPNDDSSRENTLLPTAIITIRHRGDTFKARAFLDQGSEKTFISRRLQQRILLPTESRRFEIRGVGGQVIANSSHICPITIFSESHNTTIDTHAIVVPKTTRLLPSFFVPKGEIGDADLEGLDLADPQFHLPGHIDLLLGSNILPKIMLHGVRNICDSLLAQSTIFGWVISGPIASQSVTSFSLQASDLGEDAICQQLRLFWEQEEVPNEQNLSASDEYCESLYTSTTFRNSDGRYVVRLPFKENYHALSPLGHSRNQSLTQYVRMENSMRKNPELCHTYHGVLKEYLDLDQMQPTSSNETFHNGSIGSFYLPHHAVFKPQSVSTKVRVVFNASKRTTSGVSLNDVLHVGPTLQSDLMTLLLRWRLFQYVFNGDIEKMYRQILVHSDDINFQRVLFRPSPTSPIRDYALKTVTFGVNCAPYLAIRTLIQLAQDLEGSYPLAAEIIRKEMYVDDVLSGAHDSKVAIESLSQLIRILNSAGFQLKKITSNRSEILDSVSADQVLDSKYLKFYEASGTKTLGVQWNALDDGFSYKIDPPEQSLSITKRQILSAVSKLFDPAGWISPIIIKAKILLQQLWLEGTGWDENVKPNTLVKWNQFIESLPYTSHIKIPRWVKFSPLYKTQLHGFCDASEKAYCAAIYIRVDTGESVQTHLMVSKTKVAPIDPLSLPRLELCGAVLLSQLTKHVLNDLPIHGYELFLWCDSSITLGWLSKPPHTWKTFVANRVAKIIRNLGNCSWRHVRSNENPADLGSRGCTPLELMNNSLWWHGPEWLNQSPDDWPKSIVYNESPPEIRRIETYHLLEADEDLLARFSCWARALRVVSYVLRFCKRTRSRLGFTSAAISHEEFMNTKTFLIHITQRRYFPREYKMLSESKHVHRKSPLYPLNPYIDARGIIRINGRLAKSNLTFSECHPIILPVNSQYCKLYISYIHSTLLHAENNLMMRSIRGEYYISRLRSAIRKCIRSCKICIIYKQKLQSQQMGALPLERCSFSLPFSVTGLDFAGPFSIKTSNMRQAIYQKGYVCVFVCFSTKAIHLEVCSSLSSECFLATFTRFVGRRDLPQKVMSDNGTNFVGAERKLRYELQTFLKTVSRDVAEKYRAHVFQWSFIPPHAPHIGGLWEAGVKSFKIHFRKVSQNHKYTYEEFSTLLIRIEAVLNSRPLSPMSDDPHELLALTPGHFLRGSSLVAAPEYLQDNLSYSDRWERLKSQQHEFARRWKDEYLRELQRRYKWQCPKENLKINQIVVIKDDQLPPCEWRLGRIVAVHPGPDGLVRVVDVHTTNGDVTRDITKICPLFTNTQPNPQK
ncbi:uncharacterized protein LOC142227692 [Haematobia irritans]|uniref:uncharacterized protein LOC142227692 n=1 Tax=Haematobia irritans TaxID=7368 RepID=UPI003F50B4D6